MLEGRDFKVACLVFEHFVLTFKAHSNYAIAGTSSNSQTRTNSFPKSLNLLIMSYVAQGLSPVVLVNDCSISLHLF